MKETEETRARFGLAITVMASALSREADEALIEGFWRALRDMDIETVEVVCEEAARSLERFPAPVQLRRLAGVEPPEARAAAAWPEVARAAAGSGDIADPISREAVRLMGGTRRLGLMNADEFGRWARRDFERLYVDALDRSEAERRLESAERRRGLSSGARPALRAGEIKRRAEGIE